MGDVSEGITANGSKFFFDTEDWEKVTSHVWHKSCKGYIISGRRQNMILLHRYVVNAPNTMQVDHINRDKADCRKANLRFATNALNCANTATNKNNLSTGHKNVYLQNNRYRVIIRKNGAANNFGRYSTLEEAVSVANQKRKDLFGEFAFVDKV